MTVFSKTAMAGSLDQLCDIMVDIVDKAQQLAKNKIAKILPVLINQQTGQPIAPTLVVQPVVQQVPSEGRPTRMHMPAAVQLSGTPENILATKKTDRLSWMQGKS